MTEPQTPEARDIKTEGGNYNERIGKHYIHAETVHIYETTSNPSAPSTNNGKVTASQKQLAFAIAGSIDEIDHAKLKAILAVLQKISGDATIEIIRVEEGSIRIILNGSNEGLEKIKQLFESGELTEVLGTSVEYVDLTELDEKSCLIKDIARNGASSQNLSNADLSGANLIGVNLSGAYLNGANLIRSNLNDADLSLADLSGANLIGVNLRGANLKRAKLTDTDLSNADLSSADLSSADLSNANLSGADLSNANLSDATLRGTNLSGADLSRFNLRNAKLHNLKIDDKTQIDNDKLYLIINHRVRNQTRNRNTGGTFGGTIALDLPIIPIWAKLASSFLGILLLIAMSGIVGNRADDFFLEALRYLEKTITLKLWWAILILLIGIFPLLIILRHYYKAHQIAIKLNKLDESLLLSLPELSANPDINESLKRLFEDFISRTLDLLQLLDGCGIAVYAPDPNDSDFLTTWCQLESPNESKEKARFYIGSDTSRKRGVAGNTFLDKNRRVVHLTRKNGAWQADSNEYVFLVDSRSRRRLSYRTLITIPISGDANDNLGVLCLYSNNITAFDSIAVQDLLVAIAGRLSAVMLLARTYDETQSSGRDMSRYVTG